MCFNSGCKIYFSEHSFQKLILKTLFRAIFENSIVPSSVHHFCVSNWFLRLFFSSELSFTHSFSYNLTAISRGTISGGWVSEGSSLLRSKNIKSPFLKSRSGHFLYKFSNPPFHIERQMAPLLAISLLSEIVVTQSVSHNPFTANFEQRDPKREFRPSSRLVAHTVSIFGQQCSLLHRTYWIGNKLDDQITAV